MDEVISMPRHLHLRLLVCGFISLPLIYFAFAYAYLCWWHNEAFLWNTLIHENGRLTLAGSLFYFDHFLGALPMILVFSLCTVGGFALTDGVAELADRSRALKVALILLGIAVLMVIGAFIASVNTAGWERTLGYTLQSIERDGVSSKGGNWNQFQLSNIPIGLGAIGLSSSLVAFRYRSDANKDSVLSRAGMFCIVIAICVSVGITAITFPGWHSFLNPRWMAHSIREIATYPLSGIPIALATILLLESYFSGMDLWMIKLRKSSMLLIGAGIFILLGELGYLGNTDVLAIAQKPAFAKEGLSIPYLLSSHIFEHFLDFVFIVPLTGGIYALIRWQGRA